MPNEEQMALLREETRRLIAFHGRPPPDTGRRPPRSRSGPSLPVALPVQILA